MRRSRRSPDLRKRLFLLLLAFLAAACRPAPEEDLSAVFGPGERLRFDHLCAEEFDHAASVWVIFADEDAGGLALARLQAGWVGAQDESGIETPGVGLFLSRIRLARPPAGPDEALRLLFRIGDAESGPNIPYLAAGESGMLSMSEAGKAVAHDIPNGFALSRATLPSAREGRLLALAVRSTRSGEEVVLRGPEAYDFAPATGNAAPSVRVLGLLDVLNPEQEGGLVHTITEGRTFDRCIGIREGLIRKFERDAEAGKFDGADW